MLQAIFSGGVSAHGAPRKGQRVTELYVDAPEVFISTVYNKQWCCMIETDFPLYLFVIGLQEKVSS